jgi:hypothetical protein
MGLLEWQVVLGDGGEDHFLGLSQHDQEEMWRLSGGRGAEYFQYMRPLESRCPDAASNECRLK